MQSSYNTALRGVLAHEGGYGNDPRDPGGPTNYGITIADVRMYVKSDATAADVRALTVDQAKAIYKSKYWDKVRGDELPAGVDYAVFDFGVNSGVSRAIKYLQRIVGVEMDGELGQATLAAVAKADAAYVVTTICDQRLAFLQSLSTWGAFGKGWGARVASVRAASLAMAKVPASPKPTPKPAQPAPAQPPASGGFFNLIIRAILSIGGSKQR